jgi:hypothetical protein
MQLGNNQIEDRDVGQDLINVVQNPHLVTSEIHSLYHEIVIVDTPGFISKIDANLIVARIRAMIKSILKAEIGRKMNADSTAMQAQEFDVFGNELYLLHRISEGSGLSQGAVLAEYRTENQDYELSIPTSGCVFSQKAQQNIDNRDHIFLDTDGDWLKEYKESLVEMLVVEDRQGRRIEEKSDANKDRRLVDQYGYNHTDEFLSVADLGGVRYADILKIDQKLAIILRMHNVLKAIQETFDIQSI